jgi:hypothetical protein
MTHLAEPKSSTRLRPWLQAENVLIAGAGLWAYHQTGAGWGLFALCILLPDLAMLGYLRGPRFGALCYNLAHSYIGPVLLAGGTVLAGWDVGAAVVCIWAVHIAIDRAIGYGLKYPHAFKATHLDAL